MLDHRQRMHDAQVDEARFLVAGDDLDGESQRGFGLAHELLGVLRHAQRVGPDHPHGSLGHSHQAFREATKRGERTLAHLVVEDLLLRDAGAQAHRFLQRIERIDLLADHTPDREVEAVGAEVDGA